MCGYQKNESKEIKKTESNLRLEGQQSPACTTARAAGCDGSAYEERLDQLASESSRNDRNESNYDLIPGVFLCIC